MPSDVKSNITIRDIAGDDMERVHNFIVEEQGKAEFECDERYIEALIKKGWLKIEGKISYLFKEQYKEKKSASASKTDYLRWVVDGKGFHFGKIALLDGTIVGVILCYTQARNRKAFLSNIAVAQQHRGKGIGSILMKELIEFYRQKSDIETIELNVGLLNSVAVKFYLDHDFKIRELRDNGYTMQYALKNNRSA